MVFLGATSILILSGILTIKEAVAAFANEGMLTVAVMYVLAKGITATGGLSHFMAIFLGKPKTIPGAQLRLLSVVILLSVVVYNTPVVVMFIPIVQSWAPMIWG